MEPEEIRQQFEYLIDSRARFLETFRTIGWAEFSKHRGATWGSMLAIFLHMLDDEEGWWQIARNGGSLAETPDRRPEAYRDFRQLSDDNARVGRLTRSRLAELSIDDLSRTVEFEARTPLSRTFERIVMHAWVDEVAHLGEFVCLLWQMGVVPPFLDWLDYHVESHS